MAVLTPPAEQQLNPLWNSYEAMTQTAEILKEERVLIINRLKSLENRLAEHEPDLIRSNFESDLETFEDFKRRFPDENNFTLESAWEQLQERKKVYKSDKL
jgi:hypothetical protein